MSDSMLMSLYVNVAFVVLAGALGYNKKSLTVNTKVSDPLMQATTAWTQVVPALIVAGSNIYSAQQALMYGLGLYVLGNVTTGILSSGSYSSTEDTLCIPSKGCTFLAESGVAVTNIGASMVAGAVVLAVRGESLFR